MTITLPERLAVIAEDLLKGRFIDSGRWDLHNGHDYHDRTSESTPTSSSQRHRRTSSSPHDGEMESRKKGNSYTIELMAIARKNATLPITELVKENPILWESMTRTGRFKIRPFESMGKTISEFLAFIFDLICGGMEGLSEEENAWN